jgi:hypothetical protein
MLALALIGTTTLESSVTPSPTARLTINALDTQIGKDNGPVNPADTFPAGFTRIYFFGTYTDMSKGVLWRRELWMNGEISESHEYLWGQGDTGTFFFFFGKEGGFQPGKYEIRLYIGSGTDPAATSSFSVTAP